MANDLSTIQSLKAVDAWIDVINANINGGVRTAFKSSRLRFAGSNTMLDRAPTATSLPLQLPEPGLITANTVIDFTPGAITRSSESTHFAIQGHPNRFFLVVNRSECLVLTGPNDFSGGAGQQLMGARTLTSNHGNYVTRDGEFHWGPLEDLGDGVLAYYLRDSNGNYVAHANGAQAANGIGLYYNHTAPGVSQSEVVRWRGVGTAPPATPPPEITGTAAATLIPATIDIKNPHTLTYSRFGSTVFVLPPRQSPDIIRNPVTGGTQTFNAFTDGSLHTHALEASNSSMTQSVPELSLAQKLFSALTKVLQIGQTNTDSVLNLVR